jgi:hypothetical protein
MPSSTEPATEGVKFQRVRYQLPARDKAALNINCTGGEHWLSYVLIDASNELIVTVLQGQRPRVAW